MITDLRFVEVKGKKMLQARRQEGDWQSVPLIDPEIEYKLTDGGSMMINRAMDILLTEANLHPNAIDRWKPWDIIAEAWRWRIIQQYLKDGRITKQEAEEAWNSSHF